MGKSILKLTVILLILAGGFTSCQKSDIGDIWVCNPEPNVTITLTFDSLQSKAYVNTKPQDLGLSGLSPIGKKYLFYDGTQYAVHGDTIYSIIESTTLNSGFVRRTLTHNSIELQCFGMFFPHLPPTPIQKYLFNRKK